MTHLFVKHILMVFLGVSFLGGIASLGFVMASKTKSMTGTESEEVTRPTVPDKPALTTDQIDFMLQKYIEFADSASGQQSGKLLPTWFMETYMNDNHTDGMAEYHAFIEHYNDTDARFTRSEDLGPLVNRVRDLHDSVSEYFNPGNWTHNMFAPSARLRSRGVSRLLGPVFPDKVVTCCGWCHLPQTCRVMFFTPIIGDLFCLCSPPGFMAHAHECCERSNNESPPPGSYECPKA